MSCGLLAPVSAIARGDDRVELGVVELGGQVALDQRRLGLLLLGELGAAAVAELRWRPRAGACARAGAPQARRRRPVLGGLLELGQDQPQRADALFLDQPSCALVMSTRTCSATVTTFRIAPPGAKPLGGYGDRGCRRARSASAPGGTLAAHWQTYDRSAPPRSAPQLPRGRVAAGVVGGVAGALAVGDLVDQHALGVRRAWPARWWRERTSEWPRSALGAALLLRRGGDAVAERCGAVPGRGE